jgi:hypothetical protein
MCFLLARFTALLLPWLFLFHLEPKECTDEADVAADADADADAAALLLPRPLV